MLFVNTEVRGIIVCVCFFLHQIIRKKKIFYSLVAFPTALRRERRSPRIRKLFSCTFFFFFFNYMHDDGVHNIFYMASVYIYSYFAEL